jgi:hypothetical protein
MCASFFAYDYRHERLNARVSDAKPRARNRAIRRHQLLAHFNRTAFGG